MTSRFDATTTTTCGYCGVGCRLEAHRSDGRIASISPAMDGPANKGHTCVKGRFAHQFARSRDRLTAPLIRESGSFRLASWDEAIARIADEPGVRVEDEDVRRGSLPDPPVPAGGEPEVLLLDDAYLRKALAHEVERAVRRAVVDDDRLHSGDTLERPLDVGQPVVGDDDGGEVRHPAPTGARRAAPSPTR